MGAKEPWEQTSASTASGGDRRSTNFILSKIPDDATCHGVCNKVCAFTLNFCPVDRHSHFRRTCKRLADRTVIIRQRSMRWLMLILLWMIVTVRMRVTASLMMMLGVGLFRRTTPGSAVFVLTPQYSMHPTVT
jgi:hypothetical protein